MAVCCTLDSSAETDGRDSSNDLFRVRQWLNLGIALLLASQTMIVSLAVNLSPMVATTRLLLHIILVSSTVGVFALVGQPLLLEAWHAARQRTVVIEQLFLLGILGAFIASLTTTLTGHGSVYYEVVSILLGIYLFGKIMAAQRRESVERASFQITHQFSLCHRLLPSGLTEEVRADEVQTGEKILLRAGEAVSVDGRVLQGIAYVQETPLTGEPFPVVKRLGDLVLAGSEVIDADLTITATSAGDARRLDQLLEGVRQARLAPSSLQREADLIMTWFLPLVVSVSVLTLLFWLRSQPWTVALFRSMSVLLVACPCAMGLATPIAFWGALSALVRRGWRVKSSDFIQRMAQVDTVVFDKTGTLSEETLKLVDFVTVGSYQREEILSWITGLQRLSTHPIARAFHQSGATPVGGFSVLSVESLPAIGLRATVSLAADFPAAERRLVIEVGNHSVLLASDVARAEVLRQQLKSDQCTHEVWIRVNGQLCALAQLRETLRQSAREAFDQLDRLGIDVQVMTGDSQASAERLGLPKAQTSLTPTEKAERVRLLQQQGHRVLFIGDGLNDAAALAEAHASLTPSHAANLAQASSQAVIHDLHWGTVPEVLQLSRQTVRGIRLNLCFAAAYNLVGITLAAAGWLHPVAAALLMLAASATVTSRALYFAENLQLSPANLRRPKTWSQSILERIRAIRIPAIFLASGFIIQGALLLHLSHPISPLPQLLMGMGVLLSALTLYGWSTIQRSPVLQMAFSMLSMGNLGMLVGWWADVGFGPIILNNQVQACCLPRLAGHPIPWHFSYMQLGMLLGSFPFMLMINDPRARLFQSTLGQWLHALVGSLGMLLGMNLVSRIFGVVPILDAHTYFNLYYAAMTIGMLLGMFAFCGLWRIFLRSRQPEAEEVRNNSQTSTYVNPS